MTLIRRTFAATLLAWLTFAVKLAGAADAPSPTFEKDVRPILKAHCLGCHGGDETLKGKLDLRLKRFAERG
ncbi:hypothetical protein ACYOEI_27705, partial [Singulisphaera rosea]